MARKELSQVQLDALHNGLVIPAHPLALTADRQLDEKHQRALSRYYMAAGTGGIAVGVHSTQFEIRDPEVQLFEPVLRIASEEVKKANLDRPYILVAGICGPTEQALNEVKIAKELDYDLALVSMGSLPGLSEEDHLQRIAAVAEEIPVCGFYLQPAVGGRVFSFNFWKALADIPGVVAIKMAPFNRYQTIDVVRAVCQSERRDQIAIYTGNDDNIVNDLLTTYRFNIDGKQIEKKVVGGLLGHWAVWTKKAVEMLEEIKKVRDNKDIAAEWLTTNIEVTETNAAFFDSANQFAGCIPGIHEVLRRQGLLQGTWCLNPNEVMSPGQSEEIDRMYNHYPHLNDDAFVAKHLQKWLAD